MDYCMIAFASTHAAISAQNLLEGVCPIQTMPVLREISTGCGIAVRFVPADLSAVRAALTASPLPTAEYAFYGISGSGASIEAEKL